MYDRILYLLAGTLSVCVIVSLAGAIFVADFRADGGTLVGIILAALTTALSTIGGFAYSKNQMQKKNNDGNGAE